MPTNYDQSHGDLIKELGSPYVKKANPVYLLKSPDEVEVATVEGTMRGKAGSYLAYDPISGHVWVVAADYVAQHYEQADTCPRCDSTDVEWTQPDGVDELWCNRCQDQVT